jgi:hypothetical protein
MVPLINSEQICRRKTADMCNTIFEKCSRRVQRELNINIDMFWNRVSRFKSTLLSAAMKEVKDDANSMSLTVKYVDQPLSKNVEDESNNIIEALKLWCEALDKNTGEQKQQSSLCRCYQPAKLPNNSQRILVSIRNRRPSHLHRFRIQLLFVR